MEAYGGVDVQTHVFLTSALVGGEWLLYPQEKSTCTHLIGGWMGPRASLDSMK
jgi:hypothetical protein